MSAPNANLAPGQWPPVAEVTPQKPPMLLLDEIVEHDEASTTCRVRIGRTAMFRDEQGRVPGFVALEYMAQCAAAHVGIEKRAAGEPISVGFLLGTRRLQLHVAHFELGQVLDVRARQVWWDGGLSTWACQVLDHGSGATLAECSLNAMSPRDAQQPKGIPLT